MSREVQIILTEDVKGLGKLGQKKKVKGGYARNYLIPKGYALRVTPENLERFKSIEKRELKRREAARAGAEEVKDRLNNKTITITATVQESGKLYGSVTIAQFISEVTKQFNVHLERKFLEMPDHIREVGEYKIAVQNHPDVEFTMNLVVAARQEKEQEKEVAPAQEQQPAA